MKCPVCAWEHPSMLCPRCGFDSSRDYGKFPTFGAVGKIPAASARQKAWEEQQKPEKRTAPENTTKSVKPPKSTPIEPSVHTAANPPAVDPVPKNKWIAFFLCLFLGMFGAHKFYEGNKKMGILYLCTLGLCGLGRLYDCFALLFKPNPYYPLSHRKS